ncbi:hypothetical protein MFRU_023g00350 [Monilinia fructicola]|uniref:Uncharacterized protein n=1 Tax=Monilinia fructicola TaxID=38448 RepID=A0A5M9K989_MONFR|nr:hypothetical protein EYC84_007087 [Monilinia fructicola]KAG4028198.1 hypothetical protein MFRU_023g00350 [Monilinia fructicola]
MSSSPAHHVSSSPSKMKASKLLPAGEDLKRTAESMSGGEMQPIKRVKPTKRDRNQIAPTRAQTIRRKVAPKSKPLLFTSDRVNNRPDAAPLQYLSDSSHTYVPLPRLANGGCIVDSVAQNTSSAPSQHHVISRAPEESIVDSLIQQRDREITALKLELENSEMLRREGVAHEAFLREQLRDTEESLREKLKSKAAKGKAYKQKCMDLEARFDDLSQRHYTLERNHKVVKEDKQLAEKKAKIFEDAFGIVKDREIQQASYVIFEGRKTPYFISHNYGEPKITTEESTAIRTAEDEQEVVDVEDFLNGIIKECDIPVESIEEVPECLQLTGDEIKILMEEHAEKLARERGYPDSCEPLGPITHSPSILSEKEIQSAEYQITKVTQRDHQQ